jgi:hypothetical protein
MSSNEYMADPLAKSIGSFIEALNIFAKYTEKGLNQRFFFGAQHDEINVYVGTDDLSPDSDDGKRLIELGFHESEEAWAYFT